MIDRGEPAREIAMKRWIFIGLALTLHPVSVRGAPVDKCARLSNEAEVSACFEDCKNTADRAASIKACTALIRRNNAIDLFYVWRGIAYYVGRDEHDLESSIADFSKAIALNNKNAFSYQSRGMAYLDKHDYDRAGADFSKAIELSPEFPQPYAGL